MPTKKTPPKKGRTYKKVQTKNSIRTRWTAFIFVALFAVIGSYLVMLSFADSVHSEQHEHIEKAFVEVPERGLRWAGLRANPRSALCRNGAFEVVSNSNQAIDCTHGPDAAPDNIDVSQSVEPLSTGEATPVTAAAVSCDGDGVSGKRVQVMYVHASDVADRYDSFATSFPNYVAAADNRLYESAVQTGGTRHLRIVTDAACQPTVIRVTVTPTGDDSYSNTISELKAQGYNDPNRKYLLYEDANIYCGIGSIYGDDSAGQTNQNNTYNGYSRVDSGCWGGGTEIHELVHNFGGVQTTAPHATPGWHCTDDSDRMCYADSSTVTMTYTCASVEEQHLDCNKDDYFSTNPASGSYLATHWNVANSAYLLGATNTATPPPPPSTTTDTVLPTVSITAPTAGVTVGRRTTITASGSDNIGVAKLTVTIDGAVVSTVAATTVNYNWNSQKASRGTHTITIKAYDAAGNVGQTSVTVYR